MTDHELVGSLLAIPDPYQRTRMLDAACGGDEEMRYRVERMMSHSRPAKVVTAPHTRRRPPELPKPIKTVARAWMAVGAGMVIGAGFAPLMLERVIPDVAVLGPVLMGAIVGGCGAATRLGMAKDVVWSAAFSMVFAALMYIPVGVFDLTRTNEELFVLCGWLALAGTMFIAGAMAIVHRSEYLQWRFTATHTHPNHA